MISEARNTRDRLASHNDPLLVALALVILAGNHALVRHSYSFLCHLDDDLRTAHLVSLSKRVHIVFRHNWPCTAIQHAPHHVSVVTKCLSIHWTSLLVGLHRRWYPKIQNRKKLYHSYSSILEGNQMCPRLTLLLILLPFSDVSSTYSRAIKLGFLSFALLASGKYLFNE